MLPGVFLESPNSSFVSITLKQMTASQKFATYIECCKEFTTRIQSIHLEHSEALLTPMVFSKGLMVRSSMLSCSITAPAKLCLPLICPRSSAPDGCNISRCWPTLTSRDQVVNLMTSQKGDSSHPGSGWYLDYPTSSQTALQMTSQRPLPQPKTRMTD